MMICPSPVCFLCFLPLLESAPARPGHDITRLTGNDSTFARPVPSMWHSTTAHRPICQHNQKVHRQTEEEEEGIAYPIHAREEGPSQDVSHYHFLVHCSSGVEFSLTQTAISLARLHPRAPYILNTSETLGHPRPVQCGDQSDSGLALLSDAMLYRSMICFVFDDDDGKNRTPTDERRLETGDKGNCGKDVVPRL
ncbi:hypothetical protein GE21DRAFT_1603 [Neurospora crassa]|uniref:Uncharacterized protein n=1 Tax=Neurospora crassa (strain ATCC 24698 / 74-OR23-1A / CBS 708.71 / DSM 1257 / FGSC 987) TaxID=367110 RepID=Q7S0U8_NEUCR|nr:hypothetical protein NCU07406 [Neurospora crassa OR74A]EAA28945.3 hypothetical protein NCU07406 [Neurospora crassa OR74A]KHE82621.1 hypothetical protein GE21DRAFT_1603 [Neurospora crassa]|eukprot:XP_958181.3 hypothetical protein NCU07406 [Neurospora crassa OR74A]